MVQTSIPGMIILTAGTLSSGRVMSAAMTYWNPASISLPRTTSISSRTSFVASFLMSDSLTFLSVWEYQRRLISLIFS